MPLLGFFFSTTSVKSQYFFPDGLVVTAIKTQKLFGLCGVAPRWRQHAVTFIEEIRFGSARGVCVCGLINDLMLMSLQSCEHPRYSEKNITNQEGQRDAKALISILTLWSKWAFVLLTLSSERAEQWCLVDITPSSERWKLQQPFSKLFFFTVNLCILFTKHYACSDITIKI